MRRTSYILGGGLASLAIAATLYWQLGRNASPVAPEMLPTLASTLDSSRAPSSSAPTQQQLLSAPAVKDQERRLAFHSAYRSFFAEAAQLSADERQAQAQALTEQIERYEQREELAMSEALLLQLGLIKVTVSDEQAQKEQADALVARYQTRSAEREAKLKAKPDVNFQRYKSDEKRIVEEVLAMDSFPDGLSRDEYLRQRLQQAREQHYQ